MTDSGGVTAARLEGVGRLTPAFLEKSLKKGKVRWLPGSLLFKGDVAEVQLSGGRHAETNKDAFRNLRSLGGLWMDVIMTMDGDLDWQKSEDLDPGVARQEKLLREHRLLADASKRRRVEKDAGIDPDRNFKFWNPTNDWYDTVSVQTNRAAQRALHVEAQADIALLPTAIKDHIKGAIYTSRAVNSRKRHKAREPGEKFLDLKKTTHVRVAADASAASVVLDGWAGVLALESEQALPEEVLTSMSAGLAKRHVQAKPPFPWLPGDLGPAFLFLLSWPEVVEAANACGDLALKAAFAGIGRLSDQQILDHLRDIGTSDETDSKLAWRGMGPGPTLTLSVLARLREGDGSFAAHLLVSRPPVFALCTYCKTRLGRPYRDCLEDVLDLTYGENLSEAVLMTQSRVVCRPSEPCPNCAAELEEPAWRVVEMSSVICCNVSLPTDVERQVISVPFKIRPSRNGFFRALARSEDAANAIWDLESLVFGDTRGDLACAFRLNATHWVIYQSQIAPYVVTHTFFSLVMESPTKRLLEKRCVETRLLERSPRDPDAPETWDYDEDAPLHITALRYRRSSATAAPGLPLSVGRAADEFPGMTALAGGTFGAVFRAHHNEQEIALKRGLARDMANWAELDAMDTLGGQCPNLLCGLSCFYEPSPDPLKDYVFLVMPLLQGTAANFIPGGPESAQERPWREVHKVLAGLVRALEFIHTRGWVHLDIKLANLLLTSTGEAVLCDFGFAKRKDGSGTCLVPYASTPGYLAAELLRARTDAAGLELCLVSDATDVFAAGVVAFLLLSGGWYPFDSKHYEPDWAMRMRNWKANQQGGRLICARPRLMRLHGQGQKALQLALDADPAARPSLHFLHKHLVAPLRHQD